MKTVSQISVELADREAIREVIYRYCRASDRADTALLRSVYWPDAHDDHLGFSGTRDEFVDYSIPRLKAMRYNMHTVGNILIAIDDNRAEVESYFHAYHSVEIKGTRQDMFSGGRYLDNFEKRQDVWRICRRFVTVEWFREFPDSADWEAGPFGMQVVRGDLKPQDKSYQLFRLLP